MGQDTSFCQPQHQGGGSGATAADHLHHMQYQPEIIEIIIET